MFDRFLNTFDNLKKVSLYPDGDSNVDARKAFLEQVELFSVTLREIYAVSKSLQTRGHTLGAFGDEIRKLMFSVTAQSDTLRAPLYMCQLYSYYIYINADIATN